MGELFVIINPGNDIIYQKEYNINNEKEYCTLYMLAYSSLDILDEAKFSTTKNFFVSIDNQFLWSVSVLILYSGMKFIFLNAGRNEKNIRSFFDKAYDKFIKVSTNHNAYS
jgi:hypothetical protein